jgi:hypothetical protein
MAPNAIVSRARHFARADSRGEYQTIPVRCLLVVTALKYTQCHVVVGSGPRRARTIACVRPSLSKLPLKVAVHCSTDTAEDFILNRCRILSAVRPLLKGADGIDPAILKVVTSFYNKLQPLVVLSSSLFPSTLILQHGVYAD